MMACSPQRAGFEAGFTDFAVGPAISRELHAEEE
jgi:regulation of enolase protein 1 (concanavalin A-like superfamily)